MAGRDDGSANDDHDIPMYSTTTTDHANSFQSAADDDDDDDDVSSGVRNSRRADIETTSNDDFCDEHISRFESKSKSLGGRLDAAWANAEREVEHRGNSRFRDDDDDDDRTPPPVMSLSPSHPSEHTLQTSNLTSCACDCDCDCDCDDHREKDRRWAAPTQIAPRKRSVCGATTTTMTTTATTTTATSTTSPNANANANAIESDEISRRQRRNRKSILQKYRTFLQKHEPSLILLEHVMERFVFYRYLFHHDHRGIRTELYYATWNVIRWMNDVILVGWGEGMGLTVGRREEWLGKERTFAVGNTGNGSQEAWDYIQDWILARLNHVVPLIRAALTATTCLYPAVEAWSRRGIRPRRNGMGRRPLLTFEEDPYNLQLKEYQWRATTTDPSPNRRRKAWESTQQTMAEASRRLERLRFYGRLGLLAISRWARYRRNCAHSTCQEDEEDDEMSHSRRFGQKKQKCVSVPSVLRGGGELDPYERLVPLEEAEDEAKIVQYVGRRTGRRSVSRSTGLSKSSKSSRGVRTIPFGANLVRWLSRAASFDCNHILYAYALGEFLHILRPYYWSNAECTEWRGRSSASRTTIPHGNRSKRRMTSYSFTLWKAWWISLLMDLLSDKLLRVSTVNGNENTQSSNRNTRRGSLLSRGSGRHSIPDSSSSSSPSAEQAKLEELDGRQSRHVLHLLRSPMYDCVTRPLVMFAGRVLAMFPTFGLGRWAAGYALDMMNYWNEHRFMLES
ncbi:hypothetical protein ACHAXS_009721 [Conticribra weissflogii]